MSLFARNGISLPMKGAAHKLTRLRMVSVSQEGLKKRTRCPRSPGGSWDRTARRQDPPRVPPPTHPAEGPTATPHPHPSKPCSMGRKAQLNSAKGTVAAGLRFNRLRSENKSNCCYSPRVNLPDDCVHGGGAERHSTPRADELWRAPCTRRSGDMEAVTRPRKGAWGRGSPLEPLVPF